MFLTAYDELPHAVENLDFNKVILPAHWRCSHQIFFLMVINAYIQKRQLDDDLVYDHGLSNILLRFRLVNIPSAKKWREQTTVKLFTLTILNVKWICL